MNKTKELILKAVITVYNMDERTLELALNSGLLDRCFEDPEYRRQAYLRAKKLLDTQKV